MSSFNEAEAFTPRIRAGRLSRCVVHQVCFNEAEAFTPRIHRLGVGKAERPSLLQ